MVDFDTLAWTVAEGRTPEHAFQIRFRQFDADFPRAQFPVRLNIFWAMGDGADALAQVHTFEERLAAAVEAGGWGVMSMALTGGGRRGLVFHVPDAREFLRRLTEMPQEPEPYPIQIQQYPDEHWAYVDDVLSDIA